MNILLTILGIVAAIVILILLIALFIRKEYKIERKVVIQQPLPGVFDYIRHIKNQDNYSVWNQLDPAMKKTYTGTDGMPGFVYAWDSKVKEAGKGEQEITSVRDNSRVDMSLHFIKPFDGFCTAYMTTTAAAPTQTEVAWGIHGKMKYPMNIMLPMLKMEDKLGNDIARGLQNLKKILE